MTTYLTQSPLLGQGQASAEAVQAWFEFKGPGYKNYAPDKQYQAPPPNLGAAIVDECRRYPEHVVNHDLAASQILHETAAWQSKYARERYNPGGLGAINGDEDQAHWFASVADGVRAHVAHMLVYAVGDGPWSGADPRRDAVAANGWLGSAQRLVDLQGKWAWPGTGYAQAIATLANQLIDFANNGSWGPPPPFGPPAGWTPPPIRIAYVPVGRSNRPGIKITPRKNIFHDTGNPNPGADAEAHRAYVHGGGGKESTSYQYVVDDHEIVALIPEGEKAYHALDPCNSESNGIELCINSDGDWNRTLWNGAWLGAQLEERGVTDHRQHHDCTGKNCPARLRDSGTWDDFLARIAYFRNVPPPVPPPTDDAIHLNGFQIVQGFKGFWEELAGYNPTLPFRVLGLPLENEHSDQPGRAWQRFERGVLKWMAEEPIPYHIQLMPLSEMGDL